MTLAAARKFIYAFLSLSLCVGVCCSISTKEKLTELVLLSPVGLPSNNSTCNPAPPPPKNICFATNTTSSTTFIPPQAECPLSGNRYYTVPHSNLTFERQCDTDYPGSDMASFPSSSMADCLAVCAQLNLYPSSSLGPCKGVTWVFGNAQDSPQGQNVSFCYPKYQLPATAQRAGAESAWILGET